MTEEDIQAHQDQQNRRAFTYLSGDAVRWMQKRKPAADSNAKNFIPDARTAATQHIRGLDFDGSGRLILMN